MSGEHSLPSISGRGHSLPSSLYPHALYAGGGDPPSKTALALMIAGAAVAGAVVWHFTRESYYTYVPPRVSASAGTS